MGKSTIMHERKMQMIESAKALFLENGFEKTTMQAIADHAEVGVATLFRYFPKKDLLIVEVICQILENKIPPYQDIKNRPILGIEKVELLLDLYINFIHPEEFDTSKLLVAYDIYITFNQIDSSLIEQVDNCYKNISKIINDIVEDGKQDGSISKSSRQDEIVLTILNMFGTAAKHYTFYESRPTPEGYTPPLEQLMFMKKICLTHLIDK